MKEWKTQIFCMPSDDLKAIKKNKFLGTLIYKGIEVLCFDHPIDDNLTNEEANYAFARFFI